VQQFLYSLDNSANPCAMTTAKFTSSSLPNASYNKEIRRTEMILHVCTNAGHYSRFTVMSVCHLCVYVMPLSSSFQTLNTDGSSVFGIVPCEILRHVISNLTEFIPLCIQKIFKIMLNELTQMWFYLKATCFGLNVAHQQAKNVSRRAACCMRTCHSMTVFSAWWRSVSGPKHVALQYKHSCIRLSV
jgi:hypothetical protein